MGRFITIVNGNETRHVTEGAYRNFFRDFGWSVAEGNTSATPSVEEEAIAERKPVEAESEVAESAVEEVDEAEDEIADEEWEEAIAEEEVEKPLSEMSHDELVAKAESLGISTKGNNSQLRNAIKNAMM